MIARIWRGWTTLDNAPHYEQIFRDVVLPKVTAGVEGFIRANLLKENGENEVAFTTIFWFDSMAAVIAFAGEHYQQAVVPQAARDVLLRFDDTVHHHEVVLESHDSLDTI